MLATFKKDKKQSKKLISSYIETPYLQLLIAVFDIKYHTRQYWFLDPRCRRNIGVPKAPCGTKFKNFSYKCKTKNLKLAFIHVENIF